MKEKIEYSLLIVGVCLIIVAMIIPFVKKIAIHINALDIPDARKVHTKPIPRLGGLGIFIGFLVQVHQDSQHLMLSGQVQEFQFHLHSFVQLSI